MTPNLALPLLAAAQAQKHVTHNEALARLDGLVQLSVLGRRTAPPAGAVDGERWLVLPGATGAFEGRAGTIAHRSEGSWQFLLPRDGWLAWDAEGQEMLVWRNSAWSGLPLPSTADRLTINASDTQHRLFVAGPDAVFTHDGADHRLVVNKAAAIDTASVLFETGWSARAELGLCGSDTLQCKVSPNGSTWSTALQISPTTGLVTLPLSTNIALGLAGLDAQAQLPRLQLPVMEGDEGAGGTRGAVPAPAAGAAATAKVLGAQGDWITQQAPFRNRLRNAGFSINQRAVSATVTLAAGAFGHDGVKAGAAGATYTFAAAGIETVLTVTAGSIILPVEARMVEGGAYILAQDGTAPARVWAGTGTAGIGPYASASRSGGGLQVNGLAANTQVNVEFSTGTVLRPQLEPGDFATPFERRPFGIEMLMCQRYFYRLPIGPFYTFIDTYASVAAQNCFFQVPLPVPMRAQPAFSLLGTYNLGNCSNPGLTGTANLIAFTVPATAVGRVYVNTTAGGGSFNMAAEL